MPIWLFIQSRVRFCMSPPLNQLIRPVVGFAESAQGRLFEPFVEAFDAGGQFSVVGFEERVAGGVAFDQEAAPLRGKRPALRAPGDIASILFEPNLDFEPYLERV